MDSIYHYVLFFANRCPVGTVPSHPPGTCIEEWLEGYPSPVILLISGSSTGPATPPLFAILIPNPLLLVQKPFSNPDFAGV